MHIFFAKKSGFTLIELLIVIAILAILAVMLFITYGTVTVRTKNSRAETELTTMGKSVEIFKAQNGDHPLIVQQPYWPPDPSKIALLCFGTVPTGSCYPINAILPNGNNGFTDYLFNGTPDSPVFNNTRVNVAAATSFAYAYATQDCSMDSIALSGGHHKISNFTSYLIATGLSPAPDGSSPNNFWIRDGNSGTGPDTQVPVLPFDQPAPYNGIPGFTATMTTCQYNYP